MTWSKKNTPSKFNKYLHGFLFLFYFIFFLNFTFFIFPGCTPALYKDSVYFVGGDNIDSVPFFRYDLSKIYFFDFIF